MPRKPPSKEARLLEALWKRSLLDPQVFLFGDHKQNGMVSTIDEHDAQNPIKPLPGRPHLRTLTNLALDAQMLAVAKSRQLLCSWWGMGFIDWKLNQPAQRWGVLCRKFELAEALVERMWGIQTRIPIPEKLDGYSLRPRSSRKEGEITVYHDDLAPSKVLALPEDSEAPRSMVFSGLFIDEGAFTDNLDDLLQAATPTIMGGGQLFLVSSPNGRGVFYDRLTDHGRLTL